MCSLETDQLFTLHRNMSLYQIKLYHIYNVCQFILGSIRVWLPRFVFVGLVHFLQVEYQVNKSAKDCLFDQVHFEPIEILKV